MPGRHNLLNALAAVAVGLELGVPFERSPPGLREFQGAERRFEVRGESHGVLVVDDYGHHPTEIAAVLAAARALHAAHRRRVPAAPVHAHGGADGRVRAGAGWRRPRRAHRHLRGRRGADSRRHARGAGASVVRSSRDRRSMSCRGCEDVAPALVRIARPGDVVITLGAGSIGTRREPLMRCWREARRAHAQEASA